MKNTHHELRAYRKSSPFSLADIANLLGTKDSTQIGRHETNPVSPQLELALLYHVLFKTPITAFFPDHVNGLIARLKIRIPNLLDELKCLDMNEIVRQKMGCLQSVLTDLNDSKTL
ncbi:MAG: hypothetical protein K1X55_17045 [Chitinophagales bacterium]|nr:hypothetical protein [Chitinophagales bacterium]